MDFNKIQNRLGFGNLISSKPNQDEFHANVHVFKGGNAGKTGSGEHVYLQILQGEDLPAADLGGKSDPFCSIRYAGEDLGKTEWIARTLHPVWGAGRGELFCFPHFEGHNEVTITVLDHDRIGSSTPLGSVIVQLDLRSLPNESNPLDKWMTLRPGKPGLKGGPGTIRFRLAIGRTVKPTSLAAIKKEATQYIYVICLQGKNLKAVDWNGLSDVYCTAKVNSGRTKHTSQVCRNTVNPKWSGDNMSFVRKRKTTEVVVKVFDDSAVSDSFMGMVRIDLTKLEKSKGVPFSLVPGEQLDKWYEITPGTSMLRRNASKGSAEKLGKLKVRLGCGFLKSPPMSLNMRPSWRLKMGTLKVSVIEARDLLVMDVNTTDAFVKLTFEGREEMTNVCMSNLNPRWNQCWEFDVTEITSDIMFRIFDEDIDGDTCFGMGSVPVLNLLEDNFKELDTWIMVSSSSPPLLLRPFLTLDKEKVAELCVGRLKMWTGEYISTVFSL
mmetsp:Transcript_46/g.65  ORF Transcript_46/g.65 Transcript_46/m.65 type:complete len:494 (+) Transcript_46:96-1577(+)